MGLWITVAPAARVASSAVRACASMPVLSITSCTAPCRAPPALVKSFWNSISTSAVVSGFISAPLLDGAERVVRLVAGLLGQQLDDVPVGGARGPRHAELAGAVAAGVRLGTQARDLRRLSAGRRGGQLRVQHPAVARERAAPPVERHGDGVGDRLGDGL